MEEVRNMIPRFKSPFKPRLIASVALVVKNNPLGVLYFEKPGQKTPGPGYLWTGFQGRLWPERPGWPRYFSGHHLQPDRPPPFGWEEAALSR